MTNERKLQRTAAASKTEAAMYARRLEWLARAVRANEGRILAACPDTSDLLTLGGELRSRDLERRRRELEEPVCSAMRAAFTAPEMADFVQQLVLHGRGHIARDDEPEMCVISPSLEGRADRLAERLRTSWGLALRRFQADLIAEAIDALAERLESRRADAQTIKLPPSPPLPTTEDIRALRSLAARAEDYGCLRLDVTLGLYLASGHAPVGEYTELSREAAQLSRAAESAVRALLAARGVELSRDTDAMLPFRFAESDPAPVLVRRPTLFQAAYATAEFLRSPAGLQPGRVRADDIASLLEQLAAVSRQPVRHS